MIKFFLSLKTSVWTLLALIGIFFVGSYMMPTNREIFSSMNDDLLYAWAERTALNNLWYTWWFFAAVAVLVILMINTLVCSIQAIRERWSRSNALLLISPQITHIGFLFILLAHLLGAGWGFKISGALPEGAVAQLPEMKTIYLRSVHADVDPRGFPTDWSAEVTLMENNRPVASGTLGPNSPLLYNGIGIYIKSFELEPRPYAVLLVAKDPGAILALVGGLLFMLGSLLILVLKWKKA
jgi:cytochrome c biogenesis protein ResB